MENSSASSERAKKIIITSGYFNPIHIGHINLIKEAKKLGDVLVVVVNNDEQVKIKGSVPFMPEQERMEIVKALRYADEVVLSVDKDRTVAKSLEFVAKKYKGELFFAKGGDRNVGNIPESEVNICSQYNIKVVNGVGGDKVQSSSWLLKNSAQFKASQV
jgi:cytidyltransferase-like protein